MDRTMYEEQMSNEQTSLPYAINLKQSFLLDFNNVRSRQAPVDMGIIKLGSPDLERLLVQQDGSVVTALTPTTQILFPKSVTEEQEAYARGFIDALDELHRSQGKPLNNSSMITLDTDIDTSSRNILLLNNGDCENEFTTLMSAKTFIPSIDGEHNNDSNNNVINYNSRLLNGVVSEQLNSNNSKSPTSSLPPAQTLFNRISAIQQQQQKNLLQQQTSLNSTKVTTTTAAAQNIKIAINSNSNIINNPNKIITSNVNVDNNSNLSSHSFIKTSFSSQLRPPPSSSSSSTSLLSTATPNLNSNNASNQLSLIDKDLVSINLKNLFNNASTLFTINSNNNINNSNINIIHNNSLLLSEETLQTVPRLLSSSPLHSTTSSGAASLSGDSPSPASLSNYDEPDRLEMKRARNRLAAQKCRTRKLERIAVLSARVDELKEQNAKLERLKVDAARRVEELKGVLMRHAECEAPGNEEGEEVGYGEIHDEEHEMMIPVDLKM